MNAREALEKAAEICEKQQWLYGGRSHSMMACMDCAKAILALRDSLPQEVLADKSLLRAHVLGPRLLPEESAPSATERSFDQVRDGIVSRMNGHTICRSDLPAWRNFIGLLKRTEESECFSPSHEGTINAEAQGKVTPDSDFRTLKDGSSGQAGNPAASAPSASGDTQRLDWLERMHVEVRTPLVYGSASLFHASPEDLDGDEAPSDIRKQIDYQRNGGDKPVRRSDERNATTKEKS